MEGQFESGTWYPSIESLLEKPEYRMAREATHCREPAAREAYGRQADSRSETDQSGKVDKTQAGRTLEVEVRAILFHLR